MIEKVSEKALKVVRKEDKKNNFVLCEIHESDKERGYGREQQQGEML